ncbi:MAG: tetratricopeptide repeat protein [Elusimicrobia bacterium]|nr:tetratricopeptide repeat protein [Elusimicrobiota bacterium]
MKKIKNVQCPMSNVKRKWFVFIFFILLLTPDIGHRTSDCLYSQELNTLYQDAMNAFYNKDYKKAIGIWEEIIRIDVNQKNPPKLIEMARAKMFDKVKPLLNEFTSYLEKGDYTTAIRKNNELLEIDPLNGNYKKASEKLEKVVTMLAPSITQVSKVGDLMRKSIAAHVAGAKDERIPVLASRYAWQLDSNNKFAEKVFLFMEKEYITIARMEVMERGKNVIEQKLAVILEDIYDGKYEHALIECEIVLAIESENVMGWKRLGSIYYALGKRAEAKSAWEKALKLDPKDKDIARFYKRVK